MNIRPITQRATSVKATAAVAVGFLVTLLADWILPHAVVRGVLGVAVIAVLIAVLIWGAKACARGELTPGFDRTNPSGECSTRECTRAHAHTGTRAREAA